MDSLDNFRERVEALEQRTAHFHQQTRTVERRLRWWRGLASGLLLVGLVSLPLPTGMATEEHADKDDKGLAQRVRKLEAQVKALQATLAAVAFDATTKELVITGANLRIVNGLGRTDCGPVGEEPIPDCPNGLGNLIVGYNEPREGENVRTGSHNVVVGTQHNFLSSGGIVVGLENTISGTFASVSGGARNNATGFAASVSGGDFNTASGFFASVSGGVDNTASGPAASVSGGEFNTASGDSASVSGGINNTASGFFNPEGRGAGASVSGGDGNTASGFWASVCGGRLNTASGFLASVSGGDGNTASGTFASVSGGQSNTASGDWASVSGGLNRTAEGENDWRGGSFFSED
jgi:hypothetical protein